MNAAAAWTLPFAMTAHAAEIRHFADRQAAENRHWWNGIEARAAMLTNLRGGGIEAAAYANHVKNVALAQKRIDLLESGIDMSALFSDGLPKRGIGIKGVAARIGDLSYCSRKLRGAAALQAETVCRNEQRVVHRRRELYVSDAAVKRCHEARVRNLALLASLQMVNEQGQTFSLEALAETSLANPANRRTELMVRIAGFETVARACGDIGEFFTLTCPSRFHAARAVSSTPNPKFDGSTPADAQAYLNRVWRRIRAALDDEGIGVYGFRVAEPHHDGTPHWHGLLFMKPEHRKAFRRIVALHACRVDAAELGLKYFGSKKALLERAREVQAEQKVWRERLGKKADTLAKICQGWQTEAAFWAEAKSRVFHFVRARVDFKAIDWSRGSAAGYIAKYIAKNIDGKTAQGESVGTDYETDGADVTDTAKRVQAWASTWGIRQFQQIGGVPVGIWRELRRIDVDALNDDSELIRAARAADAGDWGKFVMIMGGAVMRRDERPLQLHKEQPQGLNKYGEEMPMAVRGVLEKATGEVVISRIHEWRMLQQGGKAAPWTCVNNCRNHEFEPETPLNNEPLRQMNNIDMEDADIREWLINGCGWSAANLPEDFGKSRPNMLMGMRRWKQKMTRRNDMTPQARAQLLSDARNSATWTQVESGYAQYMRRLNDLAANGRRLLTRGSIVPPQQPSDSDAGRQRLRRFPQPQRVWKSAAQVISETQAVMDAIDARMQAMADAMDEEWI